MVDREARLKHLLDQLGAELEELAPMLGQYYRALAAQDIPDEIIARMLSDMQMRLLGQNPAHREGGES